MRHCHSWKTASDLPDAAPGWPAMMRLEAESNLPADARAYWKSALAAGATGSAALFNENMKSLRHKSTLSDRQGHFAFTSPHRRGHTACVWWNCGEARRGTPKARRRHLERLIVIAPERTEGRGKGGIPVVLLSFVQIALDTPPRSRPARPEVIALTVRHPQNETPIDTGILL